MQPQTSSVATTPESPSPVMRRVDGAGTSAPEVTLSLATLVLQTAVTSSARVGM